MSTLLQHIVDKAEDSKTAEYLIRKHFRISAGLFCELKHSKRIFINSVPCRSIDQVKTGDIISADVGENLGGFGNILPFECEIQVLYEDEFLLVVDKPGGMESHPCMANYDTTLANAVMYYWSKNGEYHNYHIVNRLDKGTSGICVIAKNRFAHGILSEQIKTGDFKKWYKAIVTGNAEPENGVIELPIERCNSSIIKRRVSVTGKYAKTVYKKICNDDKYSLLEISLETGRTHQIRVHFSHIGYPLVGDWLYGNGDAERDIISRQALHAYKIELFHPLTNEPMSFVSKLPEEMKSIIKPE